MQMLAQMRRPSIQYQRLHQAPIQPIETAKTKAIKSTQTSYIKLAIITYCAILSLLCFIYLMKQRTFTIVLAHEIPMREFLHAPSLAHAFTKPYHTLFQ